MNAGHPERSTEAFFGRRRGKRLRPRQVSTLETLLPHLRIDLEVPAPDDPRALFAATVGEVRLEIGFGGGEHLLTQLERYPETGFIGVEPFVNGMAKLLTALEGNEPKNLRLYDDDATRLLDWLPEASLSGIDLLYADPWPKKRHWKRRFINRDNLDRFARVMKPGAVLRFASDIESYINWTLLHCREHPSFSWRAASADDWRQPYANWPGTRYEAKAVRQGRVPAYLSFVRV
ncbi:tRNA (guanine(46)-N(7))-methyltransferase TrmB [Chelativorans sp. YIM 93263]|uniref:tRNA (guanine(46)-N(7))-methyltransferase TrmB n=1 Tax=Chelativorans sp. YIM 93263 TaxID=2906648 RepID=UPI0023782211|nr:tRNA (guanine(46)-N(7))-methyltransferase TrmB [Chelativorans sp. YIM 93263]